MFNNITSFRRVHGSGYKRGEARTGCVSSFFLLHFYCVDGIVAMKSISLVVKQCVKFATI